MLEGGGETICWRRYNQFQTESKLTLQLSSHWREHRLLACSNWTILKKLPFHIVALVTAETADCNRVGSDKMLTRREQEILFPEFAVDFDFSPGSCKLRGGLSLNCELVSS